MIGAGLSGLAAGIYGQMNGYRVRIFEHAGGPGGVAASWKRRGYSIDGGIHFYMGYKPGSGTHEMYRELGVYQPEQYLEITNYARYLDSESGDFVDVTPDLDRLAADLKERAPEAGDYLDDLLKGARAFKGSDMTEALARPPDLTNWWDNIKMTASMRKTLRYYMGRHARPVNQATAGIRNPWVRGMLERLFLPEVPSFFLMMLLGMLADRNMAVRRDGSMGFARALEKRFIDLGGEITYKATVEEILVENDAARGVRLSGGEEYRADRIVATGDGQATLFHLLKGRYLSATLKKAHEAWPLFRPVLLLNYGTALDLSNHPHLVLAGPFDKTGAGFPADDWLSVRIFNYGPDYSPPGRTLVQAMIESEWAPWKKLREDRPAYQAEKERLASEVLGKLERIWPGISSGVDMTDVATPYTWWRYTLNREGAYEGFAITPEAFRTRIYRTLPGLKNLVLAGQWTSPGGGVPPSLMTGRHAVMILCRQDKRAFRTETK